MRRPVLAALLVAVLGCTLAIAASGQTGSKVAVVGRLHPGSAADPVQLRALEALREGMRGLGHVEGATYILEARFADGDTGRLPALADELVRLEPDVILGAGYEAVRSLMDVAGTIPIIMASVTRDPVRAGFVAGLARPGGNVTGLAGLLDELNAKQLELLRELVPGLAKVAVLYNSELFSPERLQPILAAAASLDLRVHLAGIARPEELETAFEAIRAARAGGLVVLPEPAVIGRSRARIAALALRHRLPSVFTFRIFTEAGGLMSYAHDLPDMHRRSAAYVDKILKGAKPGELPVERPARFELVINLKTARALGIAIPASILVRADEVIE